MENAGRISGPPIMKGKVNYMGAVALTTLYNQKMAKASKIGQLNATFLLASSVRNLDMLRAECEEYQFICAKIEGLEAHERETMYQYGKLQAR